MPEHVTDAPLAAAAADEQLIPPQRLPASTTVKLDETQVVIEDKAEDPDLEPAFKVTSTQDVQLGMHVTAVAELKLKVKAEMKDFQSSKELSYTIEDPDEVVDVLHNLRGTLAPLKRVDDFQSPKAMAKALLIPKDAVFYAFAYPLNLSAGELRAVEKVATQTMLAATPDSDVAPKPPCWLDFLLVGGFVFFDDRFNTLVSHALSISRDLSEGTIRLVGPGAVPAALAKPLVAAGRFEPTAAASLREAGISTFSWLGSGELSKLRETKNKKAPKERETSNGSLVFAKAGGTACFYYRLWLPGEPSPAFAAGALEHAKADTTARELSGAIVASSDALKAKIASAAQDGGAAEETRRAALGPRLKGAEKRQLAERVGTSMDNAEQKEIDAMCEKYDPNGDGVFSRDEVKAVIIDLRKSKTAEGAQRRAKQQALGVASVLSIFFLLSVLANFALTYMTVISSVTTEAPVDVARPGLAVPAMTVKGSGGFIQQTAQPPPQSLPLGLSTYMNHDELMSITKLMMTKRTTTALPVVEKMAILDLEGEEGDEDPANMTAPPGSQMQSMKVSYTVVGYDWRDYDLMVFHLNDGGRVLIQDGNAFQFDPGSSDPNPVCTTNVESARLKVEGINVSAIMARATPSSRRRALRQSRHPVYDDFHDDDDDDDSGGRALSDDGDDGDDDGPDIVMGTLEDELYSNDTEVCSDTADLEEAIAESFEDDAELWAVMDDAADMLDESLLNISLGEAADALDNNTEISSGNINAEFNTTYEFGSGDSSGAGGRRMSEEGGRDGAPRVARRMLEQRRFLADLFAETPGTGYIPLEERAAQMPDSRAGRVFDGWLAHRVATQPTRLALRARLDAHYAEHERLYDDQYHYGGTRRRQLTQVRAATVDEFVRLVAETDAAQQAKLDEEASLLRDYEAFYCNSYGKQYCDADERQHASSAEAELPEWHEQEVESLAYPLPPTELSGLELIRVLSALSGGSDGLLEPDSLDLGDYAIDPDATYTWRDHGASDEYGDNDGVTGAFTPALNVTSHGRRTKNKLTVPSTAPKWGYPADKYVSAKNRRKAAPLLQTLKDGVEDWIAVSGFEFISAQMGKQFGIDIPITCTTRYRYEKRCTTRFVVIFGVKAMPSTDCTYKARPYSVCTGPAIPKTATSPQCDVTMEKVREIDRRFNKLQEKQAVLDDKLGLARTVIGLVDTLVGLTENATKAIKLAGMVAKIAGGFFAVFKVVGRGLTILARQVDMQKKVIDSQFNQPLKLMNTHIENLQMKNSDVATSMYQAHTLFHKYAVNPLLMVDKYCPSVTGPICGAAGGGGINAALEEIEPLIPNPDIPGMPVYDLNVDLDPLMNFLKRLNDGFIGWAIKSLNKIMKPIDKVLNTKRCFDICKTRAYRGVCKVSCGFRYACCGRKKRDRRNKCKSSCDHKRCPVCFKLADVVEKMASLIGMVSDLILAALKAMGLDVDKIIAKLLPKMFSLPDKPAFIKNMNANFLKRLRFPSIDWDEFGIKCFKDSGTCMQLPALSGLGC